MHPPCFPAESAPFHSHLLHSPPKPNLWMKYRQNKNILPFCCAFPSQGSQNHGYPGAAACICILSTVGAGLCQSEPGRDQGCASLLILQLTQPSGEGLGSSCSIPWCWFGNHHHPYCCSLEVPTPQNPMVTREGGFCSALRVKKVMQVTFFLAGRKAKLVPLQSMAGQHSPPLAWLWQHVLPV